MANQSGPKPYSFWPNDMATIADFANAVRVSLDVATPTLRQVADELKVNYRTLQSYASMERVGPPDFGQHLVRYLRWRIHNLTACADFLEKSADKLLKQEAEAREVRENKEERIRALEKLWDERDREFLKKWGPGPYKASRD
jgi:hypothetical protein